MDKYKLGCKLIWTTFALMLNVWLKAGKSNLSWNILTYVKRGLNCWGASTNIGQKVVVVTCCARGPRPRAERQPRGQQF